MIRLCLLFLALALPLRAEVFPALHEVTGVAADDVLNIRATLDAGAEVALSPLGSVSGGIVHFDAVSPDGVAIILSIYVDGRFAMTVQQDMDGPHAETTFGSCKPRT